MLLIPAYERCMRELLLGALINVIGSKVFVFVHANLSNGLAVLKAHFYYCILVNIPLRALFVLFHLVQIGKMLYQFKVFYFFKKKKSPEQLIV